jgi:lathosterol oxidase
MSADPQSPAPRQWGSGWISGTLSVTLAAMGLFAVLCFHFPSYLTMPEARAWYPLPVIRAVLHLVLVAAFALGVASIMLRHNKTLGLVGIGLVLLAALLGGSRVPVQGELKDDFYLGLDYAVLNLIVFSVVFVPLEKLFGRIEQDVFRKGWRVDFIYFLLSSLFVQLTTYLTLQPAFVLFDWAVNLQVQSWVRAQPIVLQVVEIMVLADLVQYTIHRLFHVIPWLWRFHAVHHSTEVLDWMSGNRLHIVDLAATRSLIYVPAYVLGFAESAMVIYIVFVAVESVFIHSNLAIDFGPLRWVFVTPQFHHWHHSCEPEAIDKNFAVHLPLLDVLFGTCYLPSGRWPTQYGVRNNDVPESYLGQLIYPFLPARKRPEPAPEAAAAPGIES